MMPSLPRSLLALTLAAAPLAPLCIANATAGQYGDTADAEADAAAPSPVTPPAVAFDDSMECVLDSNVGIAIDGSGSIGPTNFNTILAAVEELIKVTSGTVNGGTANDNFYYVSAFSSIVYENGVVATNAGDMQATAAAQLNYDGGGTDIAAALADQLLRLEPQFVPAFVILITDGQSDFDAFQTQAQALAATEITLVCVALGNANVAVLEQLCAQDANGAPLVFESANIGDIAILLEEALTTLDTDGDGVPDCEDECPDDPTKTREPCKDAMPGCVLDANIGISIDGSGSVGNIAFRAIQDAVVEFIQVTSGTANGGAANSNLYYINAVDTETTDSSLVATNARDAQVAFVNSLDFTFGDTDIVAALADQLAQLAPAAPAFVILITAGSSDFDAVQAQAEALTAADLTLVCVALGAPEGVFTDVDALNQLCAKDADGNPLVFESDSILDVGPLLGEVLNKLDSDKDGVPDCEDECPADPKKTREPCKGECPIPTCTCTCTTGHEDCTMSMHGSRD